MSYFRRLSPLFLLVAITLAGVAPLTAATPSPFSGRYIDAVTAENVSFTLHTPTINITPDGRVTAEALNQTPTQPGVPNLPFHRAVVAVPPGATVTAEVNVSSARTHPNADIQPVGRPHLPETITADFVDMSQVTYTYEPNADIYNAETLYPTAPHQLSAIKRQRGVQLVEIDLYPVRYNPTTQTLIHTPEMRVTLTFHNAAPSSPRQNRPADPSLRTLESIVINPEFVSAWHSHETKRTPQNQIPLPVGETVRKITLNTAGIYEMSRTDLGLPSSIDPSTIQLIHNGDSVAYQLVNDDEDATFDDNERIRFYGWPFDGSWEEKQYVRQNVYWLWADGTADRIATAPTISASTVITTHQADLTFEEDHVFSSTKLQNIHWNMSAGNQPDSMFWTELLLTSGVRAITKTVDIDLPHPVQNGPDALFTYELLIENEVNAGTARIQMNNQSAYAYEDQYPIRRSINVTHSLPIMAVINGTNTAQLKNFLQPGQTSSRSSYLLNTINAQYQAYLRADGDQLTFTHPYTGTYQFQADGFSTADANQIIAWKITDRAQPMAMNAQAILTDTFAIHANTADDTFIVAGPDAIRTPTITTYTVPNIDPAGGGADWVAVTHSDFLTATHTLADHRAAYTSVATHVVNVEDVYNQYGYGFPTPQAVKAYLQHAYDTWNLRPAYGLLVGDAHYNPRMLPCTGCDEGGGNTQWSPPPTESFMPFFYAFEDRFQGLIPSDHNYTLLDGDDLYADIAFGRLSVETAQQAQNAVNKIIRYENNILTDQDWTNDIVFVHDWPDGYDFRSEVEETQAHIPAGFDLETIGMTTKPAEPGQINDPDVAQTRSEMFATIANGASLVNWRGHGAINRWSGTVLRTQDTLNADPITNINLPVVTLSMDCLDGNFVYPGWDSLSERLLRMDNNRGSAAHWSSSGLGFPAEHAYMAEHFYEGLLERGLTALGDAVNYSKNSYTAAGFDISETYAFILQGDPAMQIYHSDMDTSATAAPTDTTAGQPLTAAFTIQNQDNFVASTATRITLTLPENVTFSGVSAPISSTHTTAVNGSQTDVSVYFPAGIPIGDHTINVTYFANQAGSYTIPAELARPGSTETYTFNHTITAAPILIAPADGAVTADTTPTFSWNTVADADGYRIQVATNAAFNTPIINMNTSTLSHTPGALDEGSYYWRVRANYPGGSTSEWSMMRQVTIDTTPPAAPLLISPSDGVATNQTNPTFDWSPTADAVTYTLHLATTPEFTTTELLVAQTETNFTPTTPLTNTTYYWRVQATDSAQNTGAWSDGWSLTIDTNLADSPVLEAPFNHTTFAVDTAVTFSWLPTTDTQQYQWQLATSPDFSENLQEQFTTGTNYQPPAITDAGTYYWRVRNQDNNDDFGSWSNTWTFDVFEPAGIFLPFIVR